MPREESSIRQALQMCHCTAEKQLTELVRGFWEQERIPVSLLPVSQEEEECEHHYVSICVRCSDGRYIVRVPLRNQLSDLSMSYVAMASWLGLFGASFHSSLKVYILS